MEFHFGKFVHTQNGRLIMSILLGLGLATIFRSACEGKNCFNFYAAPLEQIKDKIYKSNRKCVKYTPIATKCSLGAKTITFE